MPRNSNGNYSLPSGNPVSSNTLIESLWANTTLADVAQGLTESLDRYGRGTMLAAFRVADGIVTAPGVAFGSEASTGIYRSGAGVMGLAVLGVAKATLTASAFTFNTAPTWASDPASGNQLTRKTYVDNAIATAGGAFLPLTGGTLTGALSGTTIATSGAITATGSITSASTVAAGNRITATGANPRLALIESDNSNKTWGVLVDSGTLSIREDETTSRLIVQSTRITHNVQTNIAIPGTAAAPALIFNTDPNTGIYAIADNELGIATGGGLRATFNVNGISGAGGGLTGLNASNLASGTVPDARISGDYSGITNLTASGTATIGTGGNGSAKIVPGNASVSGFVSFHSAAGTRQGYIGSSNTSAATDAGTIRYFGGSHLFVGNISGTFVGDGSGITALNASNLTAGTVPDARISGSYSGLVDLTLSGDIVMPGATPDIYTSVSTSRIQMSGGSSTGLGGRVICYGENNPSTPDRVAIYGSATPYAIFTSAGMTLSTGSFTGSGAGLHTLNASTAFGSGAIPNGRIVGDYSNVGRLTLGGDYTAGGVTAALQVNGGTNNASAISAVRWGNDVSAGRITIGKSRGAVGAYAAVQASDYLGIVQFAGSDGAALAAGPSIQARASQNWTGAANGSNLNFYTVPNGATAGTIALGLNHDNSAEFYGAVTALSFSGSGSGLTSLNASNLSSGTVPNARISGALSGITTLTASGLITAGSFSGSGAALTALDASNLSSGTVPAARVSGSYTSITAIGADATIGGFDVGYRGMPIVSRNSTTAFALTDAGKAIRKSNTTAYTWTINPDATTNFEIGAIIFLLHDSTAGNITVARGSGVALVEGTTDANATLAAGERASIHKVAANRWRLYR